MVALHNKNPQLEGVVQGFAVSIGSRCGGGIRISESGNSIRWYSSCIMATSSTIIKGIKDVFLPDMYSTFTALYLSEPFSIFF